MRTLILSGLALSLFLSTPIFAGHAPCPRSCSCLEMREIMRGMTLTNEQQTNIDQICTKSQETFTQYKERIDAIQKQINEVNQIEPLDEKRLHALIQQKTTLLAEQMKNRTESSLLAYKILTPEQQTKFKKIEPAWRKNHKMKHHH